jgi:hypothetical protein
MAALTSDEMRLWAVRMAADLPKNKREAEAVAGLLCDLVDWLYPSSQDADVGRSLAEEAKQ